MTNSDWRTDWRKLSPNQLSWPEFVQETRNQPGSLVFETYGSERRFKERANQFFALGLVAVPEGTSPFFALRALLELGAVVYRVTMALGVYWFVSPEYWAAACVLIEGELEASR